VLHRVKQMARIPCSRERRVRRFNHRMTRLAESSDQRFLGRIVIQIELHVAAGWLRGA
jgi:hypothetical protein